MSHRPSRVTRLKDVAHLARLSTAPVCRILNDHGPASEAARSRVLRAAQELDYHPNWPARSLRGQRTNTVGLDLPDIENPFFTSSGAPVPCRRNEASPRRLARGG